MDAIADRIRIALEMRGMKQADLVNATGIGKSSIVRTYPVNMSLSSETSTKLQRLLM